MMDRDFRPRKNKAVVEKSVNPEAVLYNSTSSSVHIINNTAHFIWRLSDGRNTVRDIENKLKKKFNVSEKSSLSKDVEKTLNEFIVNDLIL